MIKKLEKGSVEIAILLGVAVILVVAVLVLFVRHPKKVQLDKKTTSSEQSSADSSKIVSENVQRKNEAMTLSAAIAEFINNNSGNLPTDWRDGQLINDEPGMTPASVNGLSLYKAIQSAEGAMPALRSDTLRFVTGAKCSSDGKTVADKSVTGYAVQYSVAQTDGSFKGGCVDN